MNVRGPESLAVDIIEVLPPHLQEALKHPEKMMVEPLQGPRHHPKGQSS